MTDSHATPTVFTIPGTDPFLETFYDGLVSGRILPTWNPTDPLDWARLTVLLPTRRAGRAFRDLCLERSDADAAILPRIRPIGDVDEDLIDLDIDDADPEVPPAIAPFDRLLVLTKLVQGWTRALRGENAVAGPVRVPASTADAAWLARDLAALMDQVATEEVSWTGLKDLVPADYAAYWQLSLAFLEIATDAWPSYLDQRGLTSAAERRSKLIDRQARRLRDDPTAGPIVAAGSTGSIPATARLLGVIARHPNGAVVLPGLPPDIDDASWEAIGSRDATRDAPSHPLYAMKHLIEAIGLSRADVMPLSLHQDPAAARRQAVMTEVFRPADVTDRWHAALGDTDGVDLSMISLVEAPGDQEEAVGIALCLREFLEERTGIAALVTPDRRLAGRVAHVLKRWAIDIDDSAGEPLAQTPAGILVRLVAETAIKGFDPLLLISLLKHPLALFGNKPAFVRGTARALELAVLRGPQAATGLDGLRAAIDAVRNRRAGTAIAPQVWQDIETLVGLLETIFAAFDALRAATQPVPLADLLECHVEALRAVVRDETGSEDGFFDRDDGRVLLTTLAGLVGSTEADLTLAPADYPDFFDCLIAGLPVRPSRPADPRLQIWGPLEARLQSPDLIVLGGLNEGLWPSLPQTDPWLSRPMRTGLDLQPPERRIGLSAHDMLQGLCGRRVVITRSQRSDGAPTVPSRWLQRLRPVVGAAAFDAMVARGALVLDRVARMDQPARMRRAAVRPNPKPPVDARPVALSVTEVETLIRDPYAFYARRVLNLQPVEAIGAAPDHADRGTLIHDILGTFIETWHGAFDDRALAALMTIGRERFAELDAFPSLQSVWWARFLALAQMFVAWEHRRDADIAKRHAELRGAAAIPLDGRTGQLRTRADRIDLLHDGSVEIIDFKTGAVPTVKQVNAGFAPQLPLEAAILLRDGFAEGLPKEPGSRSSLAGLHYVALRGARDGLIERNAVPKGDDVAAVVDRSWQSLTDLLGRYLDPDQGYLSRAYPFRATDQSGRYDHLARVGEWSLADDGEADAP
ncbi:MAG: double-strand break repair protein AddB [Pseudomonadota bacterium]